MTENLFQNFYFEGEEIQSSNPHKSSNCDGSTKEKIFRVQQFNEPKISNFSTSKRVHWSQKQDIELKQQVEIYGTKNWSGIQARMKNRTGKQCRERWTNHLQEGIIKGDFGIGEEWRLILLVNAYGTKWSFISTKMPGRTQNSIKNHWYCKMRKNMRLLQNRLESALAGQITLQSQEQRQLLLVISGKGQPSHRIEDSVSIDYFMNKYHRKVLSLPHIAPDPSLKQLINLKRPL